MISLSITVLPQPLSPMMQTVSPAWIARLMLRSTDSIPEATWSRRAARSSRAALPERPPCGRS